MDSIWHYLAQLPKNFVKCENCEWNRQQILNTDVILTLLNKPAAVELRQRRVKIGNKRGNLEQSGLHPK
jgi:hypothetical protein